MLANSHHSSNKNPKIFKNLKIEQLRVSSTVAHKASAASNNSEKYSSSVATKRVHLAAIDQSECSQHVRAHHLGPQAGISSSTDMTDSELTVEKDKQIPETGVYFKTYGTNTSPDPCMPRGCHSEAHEPANDGISSLLQLEEPPSTSEVEMEHDNVCSSGMCHAVMDPRLKMLIRKYVRCDSVVKCLELAGFDTPYVFSCLDNSRISDLEEFIKHTCSLITPIKMREKYVGPVFARHISSFRLSTGTICGLHLAVKEVNQSRDLYIPDEVSTCNNSGNHSRPGAGIETLNHVQPSLELKCPESSNCLRIEKSTQTDFSIPPYCFTFPFPFVYNNSNLTPNLNFAISSPPCPIIRSDASDCTASTDTSKCRKVDSSVCVSQKFHQPCTTSAFALNATNADSPLEQASLPPIQAAAAAAEDNTSTSEYFTIAALSNTVSNLIEYVTHSSSQTLQGSSSTYISSPPSQPLNALVTQIEEEPIDLERLKQHSAASACRLALRQFLNAHLVHGRDFDVDMETSSYPDGNKRITGIFNCHLCRENRDRTCAVRFSIARNRYPVLSNVLSHLKTHFLYISPDEGSSILTRRSSDAAQYCLPQTTEQSLTTSFHQDSSTFGQMNITSNSTSKPVFFEHLNEDFNAMKHWISHIKPGDSPAFPSNGVSIPLSSTSSSFKP